MNSSFDELFLEESIEDIVLNPERILYFRNGAWKHWEGESPERLNVSALARTIANSVDVELGYTTPSADAYWKLSPEHHFRAHVICYPMIEQGPEITLRRIQHTKHFDLKHFSCDQALKLHLTHSVQQSKNILICGATGAGKSSLLFSLMTFIPKEERVLILEDSSELPLPNKFSSRLLARNDRFQSRNGSTWQMTDLVIEALRMRPNRIILGECRGSEALALCRSLQTGHSGVMTTVHAGSPQEGLERISDLCRDQSKTEFNQRKLWNIILHVKINKSGKREINSWYERDS
ncbi:Flp pilus assembly complex ATPase component [bacterium]|nr:Flp pilus assembly complex ATPase component [bacterium]